jgi:hypothetical protein
MLFIPGKVRQSARRHKGPVVSTPQRILIVGNGGQAVSELPFVDADNYQFSYCAGDSRDSDLIINGRPFDWILLDGNSLHGDQMDLIRSLCTIGFFYSGEMAAGKSRCQLEWTDQGVLELHCCMQASLRSVAVRQSSEEQDSCVFEFHGPMIQTG